MGRTGTAFPVYAAQAPGCSIWSVPCAAGGSSGVPQKRETKSWACVLCLARPKRLRQPGAWRAHSPRCGAPSPLRVPSPSPRLHRSGRVPTPCVSRWPSRWMSTIQNLRKSLVRNWRPVCSAVGDAVLGAEPAPFPSPLPPASGGAGPVHSRLAPLDLLSPFVLRTAGSVFGPVNFLSLLLSHSLSCYLTKAPSDCPQGTQARSLP